MPRSNIQYADAYRGIDFRQEPQRYLIGKGEQGVLIAQPYKDELLPYWRFATPEIAMISAARLNQMFLDYGDAGDFVGMDMARKFIQMGWTRARRYANHPSGRKYDTNNLVRPQAIDQATSSKAQSAQIFFDCLQKVKANERYLELKAQHLKIALET